MDVEICDLEIKEMTKYRLKQFGKWLTRQIAWLLVMTIVANILNAFFAPKVAKASPDTRTKTVEFFVGQYYGTGIASATVTNYDFTVYLPDAISSASVIRSAYIEYNTLIDGTNDASATDFQLGVVGSLTSLSAPDVIDQTGESTPVGMKLDATAKLRSIIQAAGTYNLRFSTSITGPVHYGESAKLMITYDYDDTAATQLKTIYAWVHSQAATVASGGSVTSAAFNLGLPESSITSRSTWIETRGYVNAALNVGFYWNAETERDITWLNTTNSYGYVALVSPTNTYSPNTNNTFTIKSVSGAFSAPSAILGYTYSFDYSASTELMNSLKILLYQGTETASTATLTGNKTINLPEASITMKSSFLQGRSVNTNTATMTLGINAQLGSTPSTTGINFLANASETCGFRTIIWDVTSNLSSMTSGDNTVYWAYSASAASNIRGLTLYLNYKFAKASTSVFNAQMDWFVGQQTAASTTWSQAFTPAIADSNYTLKQSFLNHQINENATTALAATIGISSTATYTFLTTGENTTGEVWHDTSSNVTALGSSLTATLDNSRSSTKSASFLVWWQASQALITSLTTDKSDYPTLGETITVDLTAQNNSAGNITSSYLDYVIFIDTNSDHQPTAGETYITSGCAGSGSWSSGNYTKQTTGFNVNSGGGTNTDQWTCSNSNFPENTTYTLWAWWYKGGTSYHTAYTTFTSVPTLTEILFLALVGCAVFLGVRTGVIKIRKNGSIGPKDIKNPPNKNIPPIEILGEKNHQTRYINSKFEARNPKRVVSIDGISRSEIRKKL